MAFQWACFSRQNKILIKTEVEMKKAFYPLGGPLKLQTRNEMDQYENKSISYWFFFCFLNGSKTSLISALVGCKLQLKAFIFGRN